MTATGPRLGTASSLREEIDQIPHWYHVVDVAPDVSTPGWIDLRDHVDAAGIPVDMTGRRALDCGMFDGFWSFAMERRGAQVVGIDIDQVPPPDTPRLHRERLAREVGDFGPGPGFELLKRALGSAVERVSCSIMDLSTERIGEPVDFAFVGALLLHLRDPLGALERLHDCLVPGGRIALYESVSRGRIGRSKRPYARFMTLRSGWTYWYPNTACLVDWLRTAGFVDVVVGETALVRDAHGGRSRLRAVAARRSPNLVS